MKGSTVTESPFPAFLCTAVLVLAGCRGCPIGKKEARDFQEGNPHDPSKVLSEGEVRRLSVILGVTSLVSPWVENGKRLKCPEEFFDYYMGKEEPTFTLDSFATGRDGKSFYFVYQERFVKITTMYKGAGGSIVLDEKGDVIEEEGIFETALIGQEDDMVKEGRRLFEEMLRAGNVDSLVGKDPDLDYPSRSMRYDKHEHAWKFKP